MLVAMCEASHNRTCGSNLILFKGYQVQLWSTGFAGRDTILEVNQMSRLAKKLKSEDAVISSRALAEAVNKDATENHDEWAIVEGSWEGL